MEPNLNRATVKRHIELTGQLTTCFDVGNKAARNYAFEVVYGSRDLGELERALVYAGLAKTKIFNQESAVGLPEAEIRALIGQQEQEIKSFENMVFRAGLHWAVETWLSPTEDRLLVFYFKDRPDQETIVRQLLRVGKGQMEGGTYAVDYQSPRELENPDSINNPLPFDFNPHDLVNNEEALETIEATLENRTRYVLDRIYNEVASVLNIEGFGFELLGPDTSYSKANLVNRIKVLFGHARALLKGSDSLLSSYGQYSSRQKKQRVKSSFAAEVERLLLEADKNGLGLSYGRILKRILIKFPKAKTTIESLNTKAGEMRRQRGVKLPKRPISTNLYRESAKIAKKYKK